MTNRKNIKTVIKTLLLISLMALLTGCADKPLDYSSADNWAYYADSPNHEVDVFFIAPTSGFDKSYNMKMEDEGYKTSFKGATTMEMGIYDTKADFYAPYYRQVSLECYDLPEDEREKYLQKAYADVNDAFNYYMTNINNGRPYILAGFSQGSDMVKRLLENNENISDKMVAAYAIGWNFTREDLTKYPNIKMATGEDDLGVVVSFCSEAVDYNGDNIIAPKGTIGINPLNWSTDCGKVSKEDNLGACFTNYSGVILDEIPALCGAYLDENRGTLKVTDINTEDYPAGVSFLEEGNFHVYDYQFFYRNLQQNVEKRIDSYLNNH